MDQKKIDIIHLNDSTALPIILYACEGLTRKEPFLPFLYSITKS